MKTFNNSKAIAIVATAFCVASIAWLLNTKTVNSSLEAGLEKERLQSEALLSEKLLLEKDISKFKGQLNSLQDRNLNLGNIIKNTSEQLKNQEIEYNRMKKENLSLGQIRKQRKELIELQGNLQNEIQALKSRAHDMNLKNAELMATIETLQERNFILTENLNKAMFAAIDQSQIEAVKGKNEKLTVRSRKTKKLIANFEVPAELKSLSFRILDAKGNALTKKDGTIASTNTPADNSYTASSDASTLASKLQKVEMVFIPHQKLNAGIYTVEILNENLYVGRLKVKLK